jgi:hypothetical protein
MKVRATRIAIGLGALALIVFLAYLLSPEVERARPIVQHADPIAHVRVSEADLKQIRERQQQTYDAFVKPRDLKVSGLVQDEEGHPIPGASVRFVSGLHTGPAGPARSIPSGADGTFSIVGDPGIAITVEASHPDYLWIAESAAHIYAAGYPFGTSGDSGTESRVTLVLRKKLSSTGAKLTRKAKFELSNQSPEVCFDFDTGGTQFPPQTGLHTIGFRLETTHVQNGPFTERFPWKVVVYAVNGRLQPRHDERLYEAPLEGYSPTLSIEFPPDFDMWDYVVERSFFVRFDDHTFAMFTLRINADTFRGEFTNALHNPSGSRNLTP